MKQELPFAVALLAAGCLLCFSQFSGPANSSSQNESDSVPIADSSHFVEGMRQEGVENLEPSNASTNDSNRSNDAWNNVAQASYQRDTQQDSAKPPTDSSTSGTETKSPLDPDLYINQVSNPKSISFLAELAKQISNSQPIASSIELKGNLFDQIVTAS